MVLGRECGRYLILFFPRRVPLSTENYHECVPFDTQVGERRVGSSPSTGAEPWRDGKARLPCILIVAYQTTRKVRVSPWLKIGSLGLIALLVLSSAAVSLVESGGFLDALWLAANTIFTTGFSPGPETQAGQMVLVGTMLLMAPLWLITLVGVVETAAWRLEQRRLTETTLRREGSPRSNGRS
jgi:hypothetical protein